MQKTVKIGETEVAMRASAATAIRYRNIFHGDIMKELMEMNPEKLDAAVIEKIQKLGFVMAKAAERADMNALTEKDYIEWIDGFDTLDIMKSAKDILVVYLGGKVSESELKKREAKTQIAE